MRRDSVSRLGTLGNGSMWGREIKEGEENILADFMPEAKAAAEMEGERGKD